MALMFYLLALVALVSAVMVVTLGRLGDMFGRVRMDNTGFAVFACASLALSMQHQQQQQHTTVVANRNCQTRSDTLCYRPP